MSMLYVNAIGKYFFICLGKNAKNETFSFNNLLMWNSKKKGFLIDNKYNFKSHVNKLRKTASQEIAELSRLFIDRLSPDEIVLLNRSSV